MKYLKRFLIVLVYLLPAALYCSYYPIIKLGETNSMNFELSLPLIWLVLFDAISFLNLIEIGKRRRLRVSSKKLFATNGERAKRGVPVTTGDDEAGFVKTHATDVSLAISDRRFFLFSHFSPPFPSSGPRTLLVPSLPPALFG